MCIGDRINCCCHPVFLVPTPSNVRPQIAPSDTLELYLYPLFLVERIPPPCVHLIYLSPSPLLFVRLPLTPHSSSSSKLSLLSGFPLRFLSARFLGCFPIKLPAFPSIPWKSDFPRDLDSLRQRRWVPNFSQPGLGAINTFGEFPYPRGCSP